VSMCHPHPTPPWSAALACLQPLTRLATLDVPANMYWRMQRWSVTDVLEHMPSCELFTSA
jgi:hypothetical protein